MSSEYSDDINNSYMAAIIAVSVISEKKSFCITDRNWLLIILWSKQLKKLFNFAFKSMIIIQRISNKFEREVLEQMSHI